MSLQLPVYNSFIDTGCSEVLNIIEVPCSFGTLHYGSRRAPTRIKVNGASQLYLSLCKTWSSWRSFAFVFCSVHAMEIFDFSQYVILSMAVACILVGCITTLLISIPALKSASILKLYRFTTHFFFYQVWEHMCYTEDWAHYVLDKGWQGPLHVHFFKWMFFKNNNQTFCFFLFHIWLSSRISRDVDNPGRQNVCGKNRFIFTWYVLSILFDDNTN